MPRRGSIASRGDSFSFADTIPAAQAYVYGVQFLDPDKNQLDALWWMGAEFAVGLHYERFSGGQFGLGSVESRKLPVRNDEWMFELPVTFDLDDGRTVVAVTEAIGPETMTLLLSEDEDISSQGPIELKLGTPFGSVDASVEVVKSKSRTLAGLCRSGNTLPLRPFVARRSRHPASDVGPT